MKQQWRVAQIRGIWSLLYGILLLAYAYFEYVPPFNEWGFSGPFAFAAIIFAVFLIAGYIYDRVLVMWAPSQEVAQERNPYQYVPSPRDHIFWFPIYSSLLDAVEQLGSKYGTDTQAIEDTRKYLSELQKLLPERKEDIDAAIELRKEFVAKHPFVGKLVEDL